MRSSVVPGSLVVCSAHIMILCLYYKIAYAHHGRMCRLFCINFIFLFLLACDDECVGVLLNDLDNIGNPILSVNLTSFIPVLNGILSHLENRTKHLWVGTGNTEMNRNCVN